MTDRLDDIQTPEIGQRVHFAPALVPVPLPIDGRYVLLRALSEAHAHELYAALRDDDQETLQRYTADNPVTSEDAAKRLIATKLALPGSCYFAVIDRATGQAGGFGCLMRADPPNGVVELGNVLYSGKLSRSRAGTEAAYLILRHVFETLGYRRLEWKCNDRNSASRHAALRYGFTFEGVFRQHMIVKGRNRDTAWYSILDHEWPKRREIFETWLQPENFDANGKQLMSMSQLNGIGGS